MATLPFSMYGTRPFLRSCALIEPGHDLGRVAAATSRHVPSVTATEMAPLAAESLVRTSWPLSIFSASLAPLALRSNGPAPELLLSACCCREYRITVGARAVNEEVRMGEHAIAGRAAARQATLVPVGILDDRRVVDRPAVFVEHHPDHRCLPGHEVCAIGWPRDRKVDGVFRYVAGVLGGPLMGINDGIHLACRRVALHASRVVRRGLVVHAGAKVHVVVARAAGREDGTVFQLFTSAPDPW